jgi:hypothetical protein
VLCFCLWRLTPDCCAAPQTAPVGPPILTNARDCFCGFSRTCAPVRERVPVPPNAREERELTGVERRLRVLQAEPEKARLALDASSVTGRWLPPATTAALFRRGWSRLPSKTPSKPAETQGSGAPRQTAQDSHAVRGSGSIWRPRRRTTKQSAGPKKAAGHAGDQSRLGPSFASPDLS